MAYILFIDESGQDHHASPYEVLGGVAVLDARVWPLISAVQEAERSHFGERLASYDLEIKAKKLIKSKTFKHARRLPDMEPGERWKLALAALEEGRSARQEQRPARHTQRQLVALAQAKIAFCERVMELCAQNQVRAFASIVHPSSPVPTANLLRKDYAYLFERFFYFLDDRAPHEHGIVVFDELEKAQSHILVRQMSEYFKRSRNGQMRSSRVLPEPMFVHSDLTTMIQVADLIVYIVSWAVRLKGMTKPARPELQGLADRVLSLRYRTFVDNDDGRFERWSFAYIDDLRPVCERSLGTK